LKMKKCIMEWKKYLAEFGFKKICDSLFGGFVFSSLVAVPIYVILVEVMIVYMYKVNTVTVLLIVAAMGHNILWHHLTKKALLLKKPATESNLKKLFFWSMVSSSVLILAIGLVILLVMIPIWMV